jgi:hypothetical protein
VAAYLSEHCLDLIEFAEFRGYPLYLPLDPHAKLLAKRLAGLPLALATAGTYLRRSHSTFTFERRMIYPMSYRVYAPRTPGAWRAGGGQHSSVPHTFEGSVRM